jgi:drug/metabolite transporter (DMT)-like permease
MNSSLLASGLLGIASAITWGAGDFCGGISSKTVRSLVVVFFSQLIGLVFLVALALITREPLPNLVDVGWGVVAGVAGLIGLSALYTALSRGNMGLVAPVTGVISTTMPVIFGALTQGLPHLLQLVGFALAIFAVALISRTDGDARMSASSLGLAILAGVSFGTFLILIARTADDAVFWPLVAARTASVTCLSLLLVFRRERVLPIASGAMLPIALSGMFDAAGNFLFVLAEQAGRLDVAGAISSMYPASTTVLALVLLKEKLKPWQVFGVLLSFAAIPLIVAA